MPEASGFQGMAIQIQSTVHVLIERFRFACSAFAHRARGAAQAPKRPASEPGSRPELGALLQCTPVRHLEGRPRRGSQSLKTAETTRQNRQVCWHPVYMAAAPVVVAQACAHRKG